MIVDKHKPQLNNPDEKVLEESAQLTWEEEAVRTNAMAEAYKAVRSILADIPSNPDDPNSEPLFKTIKMDNGQLARIKGSKLNEEYGIEFPAVFIHFIEVYYNQGAARISEGKATMR
ncbi:MAG: hypothetical protein ACI3ZD_09035, partial [Prevotella sp.]